MKQLPNFVDRLAIQREKLKKAKQDFVLTKREIHKVKILKNEFKKVEVESVIETTKKTSSNIISLEGTKTDKNNHYITMGAHAQIIDDRLTYLLVKNESKASELNVSRLNKLSYTKGINSIRYRLQKN